MALGVERTAPHPRSCLPSRKGDVPPPTLAVQIADQLANGHANSPNEDVESFQLLLREILEANDDTSQPDGHMGNDPAVNCRLICVTVRAGLLQHRIASQSDDPHRRTTDAIRSLQAIDLTLSRCPDALFHPLDHFEPHSSSPSPLFAWLIPKVLDGINELEMDEVAQLVLAIIQRSMCIGERKVARYDVLSIVENVHISWSELSFRTSLSVSATSAIKDMLPVQHDVTDRAALIVPRGASHAFAIIVLLLSGLVPQVDQLQKRHLLDRDSALLELILSSLGRSWTALSKVCSMSLVPYAYIGGFVRCLRKLLFYVVAVASPSTHIFKASSLLHRMLSSILTIEPSVSGSCLEPEICQALHDSASLTQNSTAVLYSQRELLSPILSELVKSQEFHSFSVALQHAVVSTLAHAQHESVLQASTNSQRSNLALGSTHIIHPDETLVGASHNDGASEADAGPRKRLRLKRTTSEPEREDAGLVLSRQISHTLGLPETETFAELPPSIMYV
ncbi:MAG: hypothetical protein Q9182_005286 [Xanthomendoza sp. 2 TL-2023]